MIFPFNSGYILNLSFYWFLLLLIFTLCIAFIFILFGILYKTFKLTFKSSTDYQFEIDDTGALYRVFSKILLIFLSILAIFTLRIFRRYFFLDFIYYRELLEIIYYSRNTVPLPIIFWSYLFLVALLLFLLSRLGIILAIYRIKFSFIRLHLYYLQVPYYNNNIRYYLSALHNKYFTFYYNILNFLFKDDKISVIGIDIYTMSVLLEKHAFRYLLPYLWVFDIWTNFGVITTVFYVLPYYFLYSIIRTFLMTWDTWFGEMSYMQLSHLLYVQGYRRKQKTY